MSDELFAARSAHFYRRRGRMTLDAIRTLFVEIRRNAVKPSPSVLHAERVPLGAARYSAICFAYDRPVPFLFETGRTERVYGFLLLVEQGDAIAVFRSGLDLTSRFQRAHLDPMGRPTVERAIARHDAVFEKLSLRNMTTSRLALRSKTLEARDLQNAITASSAGRYVPQGYRVRRPDGSYSATPSTGRISVRSPRAGCEELVAWAGDIIDLLADDTAEASAFIRNFARSVDLSRIEGDVRPTFLSIDTMGLADAMHDADEAVRLVQEVAGVWQELPADRFDDMIEDLDRPLAVVASGKDFSLRDDGDDEVGTIRIGRSRIALRGFERPLTSSVFVESAAVEIGTDPDRVALARFLDAEDLFTVLFSDLTLAYLDGSLFLDEALVGGGALFMRHLIAEPALAATTSEKGDFAAGQTEFAQGSVFRAVVDGIAQEEVLICDDLGDEWADFIGVAADVRPSLISFYHAKHGDRSLSASAFHDSVGQAVKNLGRLGLPAAAMPSKHAGWSEPYRNAGAVTSISRYVRGGNRARIEARIEDASNAPDVVRRVLIVTSSLSRADVRDAFASIEAGESVRPNFVQLYWILMGFFSACAEMGAIGFVVCRP